MFRDYTNSSALLAQPVGHLLKAGAPLLPCIKAGPSIDSSTLMQHICSQDYRVRPVIVRRLPDGELRRDEVVGALHISERTLQRRLDDEATSFHHLLDETRRELAE